MRRILNVLHSLGIISFIFSFSFLLPFLISYLYEDGISFVFLKAFAWTAGSALVLAIACWPFRKELYLREGLLLVFLVWLVFSLIAALPMYWVGPLIEENFNFAHAFYEAMSGLTTTGASVISEVSAAPASIVLWRATLIWFGGMGILLLAVAILPLLGVGGQQLMKGEMPGPLKEDKLTPRVASTAKALYGIYFGASLLCFLSYRWAGLSWFDAWCHAASTMALGGFSTFDGGFFDINNAKADFVAIVFMLFAGINFATHFRAFQGQKLKAYLRCPEAIPFLSVVLGSALLISSYLIYTETYESIAEAFRFGFFNTVSVATTTGFANQDYLEWPFLIPIWILLLGAFSTSAGSTGGGVKMIRMVLIIKQVKVEIKRILHPHGVFPVHLGQRVVSSRVMMTVLIFLLLYICIFFLVASLLLLTGQDLITAFSAALANLANIGPGLGVVGPLGNYGQFTDAQLLICSVAMLIGRLELFTVLVIFSPSFWKA